MNNFAADRPRTGQATVWLWALVGCGVVAIAAANAHLLYVATTTQPACVAHLREGERNDTVGMFAAAKSSCSAAAAQRVRSAEGNQQ